MLKIGRESGKQPKYKKCVFISNWIRIIGNITFKIMILRVIILKIIIRVRGQRDF